MLTVEMVIIGLCLGSFNCPKAVEGYYAYNPEVKTFQKGLDKQVENIIKPGKEYIEQSAVGPLVMYVILPGATVYYKKEAVFTLNKNLSIRAVPNETRMTYTYSW